MGWLILFGLGAIVMLALWRFGGLTRTTMELALAALFAGVAGYAWQGSPWLSGSPKAAPEEEKQPDSAFALERNRMMSRFGSSAQILDAADAMHRAGLDRYAIALLRGGLGHKPNDPDLLVGLGNELVLVAGGLVTPAAELAFQRAAAAAPDHPGPPYFLGLAYAQAGQVDRAVAIWSDLLAKAPKDAPWREDVAARLEQIRQMEAQIPGQ